MYHLAGVAPKGISEILHRHVRILLASNLKAHIHCVQNPLSPRKTSKLYAPPRGPWTAARSSHRGQLPIIPYADRPALPNGILPACLHVCRLALTELALIMGATIKSVRGDLFFANFFAIFLQQLRSTFLQQLIVAKLLHN